MRTTFSLFFLLSVFPFLGNAQYSLGYNLKPQDTFLVKQTANQEMIMTIESTEQIITNETEAVYLFTVVDQKENGYTINFEFKDFALKSSSNIQGVMVDVRATEPIEGDLMSSLFHGLIDVSIQLNLLKNGKITGTSGANNLIDKMISGAGDLDEFTVNLMKKSLEKEFSSESLAKSFEQMTYIYGGAPVVLGDTWTSSFEGKIMADNTWKLEKVENGVVSISGIATITMKTEEPTLSLNLEGSQETVIQASEANGFIQKMMLSASGKGVVSMAQASGVEIPTQLKQIVTYELITE